MNTHTLGPWSINNWPHSNADMSIGGVGTPKVAIIPLRDVSINEQKANAALIAAAPELLDALQVCIAAGMLLDAIDHDNEPHEVGKAKLAFMRAKAIAGKAIDKTYTS